jgi:hypothetical protein
MNKLEIKWLKGILSAIILFMIESATNINQELFNAMSFMFEEPNLKILKPLFVVIFLIIEWIGIFQLFWRFGK